jgi:DNA processing protein
MYGNESRVYENFEQISSKNRTYDKEEMLERAKNILCWMKDNNVDIITIGDEIYPDSLRHIDEPPYGLFYKGNIQLLKDRIVAIIGSRNCSNYGVEVTKLLTKELISYNITIISGGAKGIDTVAHKTTLETNGKTIVVLGCGIDIAYPAQNSILFKKVEETGLIVSEFPPGTKPFSYNFPRRNRIISGLSEVVIVAEAAEKSGSLITANYAAEQGKEVMVVPGSIFLKGCKGCNMLIKDGASVISSLEDLRNELGLSKSNNMSLLSPIKEKILSIISQEPVHIDELVNKSYIDREELFKVLFEMRIGKEIVFLPGDYYARII